MTTRTASEGDLPRDEVDEESQHAETDKGPSPVEEPWAKSPDEILDELDVSREGLDSQEVERRQEKYGPNRLEESEARSAWSILLDQVKSLVIALLAAAAVVSMFFGDFVEAAAIGVVIVVNTIIGFVTELRAVRSMEALQEFEGIDTLVRRDGDTEEIAARGLVPGDIVVLETGEMIPADVRILEASELEIDESALTGESVPVAKYTDAVEQNAPLAERTSMGFKGTAVTRGEGLAVVVATGMGTQIGEIAGMVAAAGAEETPLEERLDDLAKRLVWLTLAVSVLVAVGGLVGGRDLFLMVQTAIALAVAAVPEGLAIVATIALARGMWRMVHRNALVRRLSSVETLGATNVICTDKTGTLTENSMSVQRFETAWGSIDVQHENGDARLCLDGQEIGLEEHEAMRLLFETAVLANTAQIGGEEGEAKGDPMEVALLELGRKNQRSRSQLVEDMPEVRVESFSRDTKMMATFHDVEGGEVRVAVKGAPEALIDASSHQMSREGKEELDDQARQKWRERNEKAAEKGLRLIGVATKMVDDSEASPYEGLCLLGLVGLLDPPRSDVPDAIKRCTDAGIRVVMVTGDHPATAEHIARSVHLVEEEGHVLQGEELVEPDAVSGEERQRLLDTEIFARVSPRQKLNLIDLHQDEGRIVAMTGDGVNDAPALKSADIGIAMGDRGTEVAREAADMVLLDDAFPTIVAAIEQGRVIFDNIRKFVLYLLSGNVGEIFAVGIAATLGFPLPLLPLQILYLNMINDVFPALALGVGPGGPHVMDRPPRDPDEPFLTRYHWGEIAGYGAVIAATILGAFGAAFWGFDLSETESVTAAFLTLSLSRLLHAFNMRNPESGVFDNEVVRNPWMWGAIALSIGLLGIAVYVGPLADILSVTPPSGIAWAIIGVASLLPLILGQIYLLIRKGRLTAEDAESAEKG